MSGISGAPAVMIGAESSSEHFVSHIKATVNLVE
jgi:hypothetical protein